MKVSPWIPQNYTAGLALLLKGPYNVPINSASLLYTSLTLHYRTGHVQYLSLSFGTAAIHWFASTHKLVLSGGTLYTVHNNF